MVGPARGGPKISLVLADVDGTLVTKDKVLTPRAAAAVKALQTAGVAFAITSGRPPRGMSMLIEPLALRTPIAAFNGGIFVSPEMAILEQHVLAADAAKRAIDVILGNNMDVWIYSGNDWFIRKLDAPHVAREEWTVKFPPTIVANFDNLLGNVNKIVGISDDHDLVARCERRGSGSARRQSVGSPIAALLSRHHPPGRQQRNGRHHAVQAALHTSQRDRDPRRHAK